MVSKYFCVNQLTFNLLCIILKMQKSKIVQEIKHKGAFLFFLITFRGTCLWSAVGGVQSEASVSSYPSDAHQRGQLYLPQGPRKRQLWQGMIACR